MADQRSAAAHATRSLRRLGVQIGAYNPIPLHRSSHCALTTRRRQ
ncbi:hypothetical protein [Streptomyces mirabilis]